MSQAKTRRSERPRGRDGHRMTLTFLHAETGLFPAPRSVYSCGSDVHDVVLSRVFYSYCGFSLSESRELTDTLLGRVIDTVPCRLPVLRVVVSMIYAYVSCARLDVWTFLCQFLFVSKTRARNNVTVAEITTTRVGV